LRVEIGWVAFEGNKIESFIPAGAACVTRPDRGLGTPYFADAPDALKSSLARFDTSGDAGALKAAIAATRTSGTERSEDSTASRRWSRCRSKQCREGVLKGDGKAIGAAWNALGLGDAG